MILPSAAKTLSVIEGGQAILGSSTAGVESLAWSLLNGNTMTKILVALVFLSMSCTPNGNGAQTASPKPVESEMADEKPTPPQMLDIVDLAASDPNFSTLVTALKKAELVDTLKGEGPFTVFAPTNAAFSKLPKETLDAVMADKQKLTAILTHHVVSGNLLATDVMGLKSATMLDGSTLPVDTSAGVKIGPAMVEQTDLKASNGVIHVIDTVLIPQ